MDQSYLHLVDTKGVDVSPALRGAVEQAFRWVTREYPLVDRALISNWAEQVGATMQLREALLKSPERFAYVSLRGKVRDWLRTRPAQEESSGVGSDLERLGGAAVSFQASVDRKILFEQLKVTLNQRDRYILALLLEDKTGPATVAKALGTNYAAAAKAIQRVKERIAATLDGNRVQSDPGHDPARFYETKGKAVI